MDAVLDRSGPGSPGHILIGGVGRAGTTLLVQWFTALGFDTGYTLDQALTRVDRISRAGLERTFERGLAYVSKSPWYTETLGDALDRGEVHVQACLIPLRELYAAAESRRHVSRQAESAGLTPTRHPGGVSFRAGRNPARQEEKLGVALYKLIHALAIHDVPTYLLPFPEFTTTDGLLYQRLHPLLAAHGVSREESGAALARVLDPTLINTFTREPSKSPETGRKHRPPG